MQTIPIVHQLRGLAALMVCIFHFTQHHNSYGDLFEKTGYISSAGKLGIYGVYIFFTISGFIIPYSIHNNPFNFNSIQKFLKRRVIRIELPYLFSIALALIIGYLYSFKNGSDFIIHYQRVLYHIFYLIPFTDHSWYNIVYWTLSIEFQFYFLIILFIPFLKHMNKWIRILPVILFLASPLVIKDPRLLFHYGHWFGFGVALYLYKTGSLKPMFYYSIQTIILFASIINDQLITAAFCLLTCIVIEHLGHLENRSTKLGEISYSLYLTHALIGGNILYLVSPYATNTFWKICLVLITIVISIGFAALFHKHIEDPSKQLAREISGEKTTVST